MADGSPRTQEAQEQAARVLAWGEMANQIAHEIKNPLTPMRLGIQHLQRVQRDGRAPIGPTLEETSRRILGEIDGSASTIARAFGFASPRPQDVGPRRWPWRWRRSRQVFTGLACGGVQVDAREDVPVLAHDDEVKEALINLLENSRNAGARHTVIRIRGAELSVEDDGEGIRRVAAARSSSRASRLPDQRIGARSGDREAAGVGGWGASISDPRSERSRGHGGDDRLPAERRGGAEETSADHLLRPGASAPAPVPARLLDGLARGRSCRRPGSGPGRSPWRWPSSRRSECLVRRARRERMARVAS
ncbi:MAG: hypothetical protein R2909_20610 [Gemmatimonadales bacterium]